MKKQVAKKRKKPSNTKNIIFGVVSFVCFVILLLLIFRSGSPAEREYTGPQIIESETMQAEGQLSEEQLSELEELAPREQGRPSILADPNPPQPRVASPRVAELHSEAVRESRQRALDARQGEATIDPETEARMEEIRKMRERQAKERNR
ncbi:MAG TPA: hypothetical protein ENN07_03535 [candidate division Zixibacteria bacterium]|nr:hypothetical protein [candidate division Zixibacteria bacterium]